MITDKYNREVSDRALDFVESVQSSLVSPCLQPFRVVVTSITGSKDVTDSYLKLSEAAIALIERLNEGLD